MTELQKYTVRVALLDRQTVARLELRSLLDEQPFVEITGEAGTIDDGVRLVVVSQPDVVLLDLDLDGSDGARIIPLLQSAAGHIRILTMTETTDVDYHYQIAKLGVAGLVQKQHVSHVLPQAIGTVANGERWFKSALLDTIFIGSSRFSTPIYSDIDRIASLTTQEHLVIQLVAQGLQNRHIGKRLAVPESSISQLLNQICSKLGVGQRLDLVIYAYHHGLVHQHT